MTITEKKADPTTAPTTKPTTKPTTAPKPEGDIETEVEKAEDVPEMKVGGKKVYIGDSPELHAITGGYDAKYCNAKSVKLNKSSVTLKVGKTTTLKATVKGVKSGKKLLQHVRKVRWYSSNVNVATVNKSGKIKATGTGKCTIWAIANNGVRTSVKVTVK